MASNEELFQTVCSAKLVTVELPVANGNCVGNRVSMAEHDFDR